MAPSVVSEAICATLLSDLAGMRKGSSGFVLIYAGLILFLHSQLGTQVGMNLSQVTSFILTHFAAFLSAFLLLLPSKGGYIVERLAKAFEENYQSKNSEFCSNQVIALYNFE